MSGSSDRPTPAQDVVIVPAVFVPDGEEPPPELPANFDSLHFRVTLDTETGEMTCDDAGNAFDQGVRAEWHPAEDGEDDSEHPFDPRANGGSAHAANGSESPPVGTADSVLSARQSAVSYSGNESASGLGGESQSAPRTPASKPNPRDAEQVPDRTPPFQPQGLKALPTS